MNQEPKIKRSDAERIRLRHEIVRLRALVDAAELAIEEKAPDEHLIGHTIAHVGIEIACQFSKLAAYLRAEEDRP
jgi:hypothetical protein